MTVSDVWNGDEPVCLGCSCLGFEASLTSAMCEEMTNRRYLEGNIFMGKSFMACRDNWFSRKKSGASCNYGNRRNKPITNRDRKCVRNVALRTASTSP